MYDWDKYRYRHYTINILKAEYQASQKTKLLAIFVEVLAIFATQRQNYKFFLIQQSIIPTFYVLLSNSFHE